MTSPSREELERSIRADPRLRKVCASATPRAIDEAVRDLARRSEREREELLGPREGAEHRSVVLEVPSNTPAPTGDPEIALQRKQAKKRAASNVAAHATFRRGVRARDPQAGKVRLHDGTLLNVTALIGPGTPGSAIEQGGRPPARRARNKAWAEVLLDEVERANQTSRQLLQWRDRRAKAFPVLVRDSSITSRLGANGTLTVQHARDPKRLVNLASDCIQRINFYVYGDILAFVGQYSDTRVRLADDELKRRRAMLEHDHPGATIAVKCGHLVTSARPVAGALKALNLNARSAYVEHQDAGFAAQRRRLLSAVGAEAQRRVRGHADIARSDEDAWLAGYDDDELADVEDHWNESVASDGFAVGVRVDDAFLVAVPPTQAVVGGYRMLLNELQYAEWHGCGAEAVLLRAVERLQPNLIPAYARTAATVRWLMRKLAPGRGGGKTGRKSREQLARILRRKDALERAQNVPKHGSRRPVADRKHL